MKRMSLSPQFCAENKALLLEEGNGSVTIGICEETVEETKRLLELYYSGTAVVFKRLPPEEFSLKLSSLFAENGSLRSEEAETEKQDMLPVDAVEDDAPVINLLNSILLEGMNRKCSDIHIEPGATAAVVRYRVDGSLENGKSITNKNAASLSVRLKMLANLNILEKRRAQDGRFTAAFGGVSTDIRLSVVPTVCGESVVMRLLYGRASSLDLESLGFCKDHLETIRKMLLLPSGLVLVTGPTGSGKTTTLNAFLRVLCRSDIKIISIEDPVEYRTEGLTQIQTDEETGMTFAELLKRVLRQDPDVIMIGEIRDPLSAELAVRAALTGHLVFATVHTNDSKEAAVRLCDMGIEPYLAAATLKYVVSQRLIKKKGGGRTLAAEILPVTEELAEMICSRCTSGMIGGYMKKNGIKTIFDDAEDKIASGIIERTEAQKELGELP